MKKLSFLTVVFLFTGVLFSVNAQDIISLKDGSTIQAKVLKISMTEIEYKRFDNQNGPTIVIPTSNVISIKYLNGVVDVINNLYSFEQQNLQMSGANNTQTSGSQIITGVLTAQLQNILNTLPAITIAGNSLKFQFNGDKWTTLLNGENFSTGTIEFETTATGAILTLKQTHIFPAAAAKTAGKLASRIPGAGAVGGVVNTASSVAGTAGLAPGAVEASGQAIILEYVAGPPAKLSFVRSVSTEGANNAIGGGGYIALRDIKFTTGHDPKSTVQYEIKTEYIEGVEKEVININGTIGNNPSWKSISLCTDDYTNIAEKLRNGSGIRFKVIGDGKKWFLEVPTYDTSIEWVHYKATISTKKDRIVQIDAPLKKLKKPDWGKYVKFNQKNITGINFCAGEPFGETKSGNYSIKIFDIEIY